MRESTTAGSNLLGPRPPGESAHLQLKTGGEKSKSVIVRSFVSRSVYPPNAPHPRENTQVGHGRAKANLAEAFAAALCARNPDLTVRATRTLLQ